MLEQRVRGVIPAQRRARRRHRDAGRLAVALDEWHDLAEHVLVELRLHGAAVEWMRRLVVEAFRVDRSERVDLHAAGVDELLERADEPLLLGLALVAAARRKQQQRQTPVAVDDEAEIAAEASGDPAMVGDAQCRAATARRL